MTPVPGHRQPAGRAFALRDPLPWNDLTGIVRAAEAAGYGALFLPEITGRDALVTLGALAGDTRGLLLGTGVLPMRSRTPLLTAMGAATVDERSGGRLVLGLGTGVAGRGALDELAMLVGSLRSLLAGGAVERRGRLLRLSLQPPCPELPIWISAMGPKAMRLAGEIADGALLNWCSPERVTFARQRIAEGAEAAGRDPALVTLGVYVRSWVGQDREAATTVLRSAAGEYASYPAYARQFEQLGLGAEAVAAAAAHRAGRPEDVPDVLVRAVTALGDQAPGKIAEFQEAGADVVVVYPVPVGAPAASIEGTLLALAPRAGAS
jgi:alkanesulfonate monooxygenase SsuD/methylene tetrahydromethanopterin reductase-like flavin-dependent oxidoreductase (luciferase family)